MFEVMSYTQFLFIKFYSIFSNFIFNVFLCRDDFQLPQDLPEPPKLFRVQRFAPIKHRIYWEKKILADFGLIYDVSYKYLFVFFRKPKNLKSFFVPFEIDEGHCNCQKYTGE